MVSSFKSRVNCSFSSCIFQSKKHYFLVSFFFVSALQFEGFLFLCVVSNVYHEDRMLIFRVLHGRKFCV